jgi:hypothetical protein
MSTTQQGKPGGKRGQRNRKSDRPDRKPEPQPSPMLEQRDEDQIDAMVASAIALTDEPTIIEATPAKKTDVPTISPAMPAEKSRIGMATIAIAYGDYARNSLQDSGRFMEKLMGVRSLDKAIEVQTEFATQCYANLVAESQRIAELYRQLARQMLAPWGLAARTTDAGPASWTAVSSQSQH